MCLLGNESQIFLALFQGEIDVTPLVIFCFLFFRLFHSKQEKINTMTFPKKRALTIFLQMNESSKGFSCPQLFFFSLFPVRLSSQKCFFFLSFTRRALMRDDICTRLAMQVFLRDTIGAANWLPVIRQVFARRQLTVFLFQILFLIIILLNYFSDSDWHKSTVHHLKPSMVDQIWKMFAVNSRLTSIVPESVSL